MIANLKRIFKRDQLAPKVIGTDLHSHLIPGIDDGSKDMQESLELVRRLYALGYRKLITTPHIMIHRFPNSADIILRGLDALKAAVDTENIPVEISAASEYYMDEHFLDLIMKKNLLTFGENEVLFEMSYVVASPKRDAILFELQCAGYTPVLAHPERYLYLHDTPDEYEALKTRGVRFQVNINSLGGFYSKPVQQAASMLMQKGWIDYLGSDTHHPKHCDALEATLRTPLLHNVFNNNKIINDRL